MSSRSCSPRPAIIVALVIGALAACDLGTVNLTPKPAGLVVHSILNSQVRTQTVLVERTLTGAVYPAGTQGSLPVDPNEAIVSDGGIPEDGARVELVLPDGRTIRAAQLDTCYTNPPPANCPSYFPTENGGGNGAGMYIFDFDGANLVPGGQYELHVASSKGELVTGDMTFPASIASTAVPALTYSRDTAALLSWRTTPAAPAYQVRVESPYGVWLTVTDGSAATLSGGLRNVNLTNLPHVFIPGFRQNVSVSAVDANVYDYYRTSSNSATGAGIVSRLRGARGVFGGIVTVDRRSLDVTAAPKEPIEGLWIADTSALGYLFGPYSMTIYLESPATRSGQAGVLTARTFTRPNQAAALAAGRFGTLTGNSLTMDFGDLKTNGYQLVAQVHGDTLIGQFSTGAPAKYIKR